MGRCVKYVTYHPSHSSLVQSATFCTSCQLKMFLVVKLLLVITFFQPTTSTLTAENSSTSVSKVDNHNVVNLTAPSPDMSIAKTSDIYPKCCPVGKVVFFSENRCIDAFNVTDLVPPGQKVMPGFPTCGNETWTIDDNATIEDYLKDYTQDGPERDLCVDFFHTQDALHDPYRKKLLKKCKIRIPVSGQNDTTPLPQCLLWKYKYLDPVLISISCVALIITLCWALTDSNVRVSLHGRSLICMLGALLMAYIGVLIHRLFEPNITDSTMCIFIGK